jgi:hypothetical protein
MGDNSAINAFGCEGRNEHSKHAYANAHLGRHVTPRGIRLQLTGNEYQFFDPTTVYLKPFPELPCRGSYVGTRGLRLGRPAIPVTPTGVDNVRRHNESAPTIPDVPRYSTVQFHTDHTTTSHQ